MAQRSMDRASRARNVVLEFVHRRFEVGGPANRPYDDGSQSGNYFATGFSPSNRAGPASLGPVGNRVDAGGGIGGLWLGTDSSNSGTVRLMWRCAMIGSDITPGQRVLACVIGSTENRTYVRFRSGTGLIFAPLSRPPRRIRALHGGLVVWRAQMGPRCTANERLWARATRNS